MLWARTGLILSRAGTTGAKGPGAAASPGDYAEAILRSMDRLRPLIESAAAERYTIKALIFRATALDIQGDRKGARQAMLRALTLAEPEGYVRSFLSEGPPVAELLWDVDRWLGGVTSGEVPSRAYVRRLLDAFGAASLSSEQVATDPAPSPAPAAPRPGAASLIQPLSDRERDILRLLPTDLTTPEIGAHLFISKSTVRTHIRHIYDKLGVHSRDAAVDRARALGLL
jgi:LuxR family maltose regulon positive regulatory protein